MRASFARRGATWLAGLWSGLIAGIGFVGAPALFATLPRADAGRAAARLFEIDAYVGLGIAVALLMLELRRPGADRAVPSRFSAEVMLLLGALFCIVAGHFALQPMIETVRSGGAGPSFAALHALASAFFVLKFVVVAVLTWRLSGRGQAAANEVRAAATTS